ncbi:hypothetical protein ADICEAN_01168 [Cesiribacter andamanensis AMV16]|uniref:Uncharacterized protein n=1 Tax=Cesiribacter andamanensis AMV16 TaxID=1279009 RepID=M7NZG4_9BACT|nr:hypothetical protein ADICEAN_01168 [Cesiribacter andamanensis AMV16]
MAGTMPLSNQVPASEPISSRIRMADMAELMLCTIPSCMRSQLAPTRRPMIPATAADSSKTT